MQGSINMIDNVKLQGLLPKDSSLKRSDPQGSRLQDTDAQKLDDIPMIKLIEVLIEQRRLEELDKQLDGLIASDPEQESS